jgi:hypothetical protein
VRAVVLRVILCCAMNQEPASANLLCRERAGYLLRRPGSVLKREAEAAALREVLALRVDAALALRAPHEGPPW